MSNFYALLKVSRQAHAKAKKQSEAQKGIFEKIRCFIQAQRVVHGGVGLKKLYHQMPDKAVGRDKFIDYAVKAGLGQKRRRKHIKTTFSVYTLYTNLLAGRSLTGINQAWSGDITYVKVGQKHGYVFLLMDVYSRRILGYIASDSMLATVNVSCLNMAIKTRKGQSLKQTIHHRAGGPVRPRFAIHCRRLFDDLARNWVSDFNVSISLRQPVLRKNKWHPEIRIFRLSSI